MDKFQLPNLQPPGAGIPWMENLILRYVYFPMKLKQSSWGDNLDRMQRETKNIINICDGMSEKNFQTRVLVDRLRGMEDSSRFWSVALTIEHLLITIKGMTHIASELAQGRQLSVSADTASVKPKQENVTNRLAMVADLKLATDASIAELKVFQENHSTQYTVKHPWFGQITSEGWVWVLAQHQALHRKQIQLIASQV